MKKKDYGTKQSVIQKSNEGGFTGKSISPTIRRRSQERYLINKAPFMGKGDAVKANTFIKLYPGLITLLTWDIPLNVHLDISNPSGRQDQINAVLKALDEGEPYFFVTWNGEGYPNVKIEPVELPFLAVIIVSRKKWHHYFPGVPCITQLVHELLIRELLPELEEALDNDKSLFD